MPRREKRLPRPPLPGGAAVPRRRSVVRVSRRGTAGRAEPRAPQAGADRCPPRRGMRGAVLSLRLGHRSDLLRKRPAKRAWAARTPDGPCPGCSCRHGVADSTRSSIRCPAPRADTTGDIRQVGHEPHGTVAATLRGPCCRRRRVPSRTGRCAGRRSSCAARVRPARPSRLDAAGEPVPGGGEHRGDRGFHQVAAVIHDLATGVCSSAIPRARSRWRGRTPPGCPA
jgi:hypothetical protein